MIARVLVLLALASAGSGCYRIRYIGLGQPELRPAYNEWHHNFIDGLIEASAPVNVSDACPEGFAVVTNEQSFWNAFVSALVQGTASALVSRTVARTAGNGEVTVGGVTVASSPAAITTYVFSYFLYLWTPTTVKVFCARGTAPPAGVFPLPLPPAQPPAL
ncbi:MAG: Bor/Iss family lipoprotein [Myxococcaceae bacterium]